MCKPGGFCNVVLPKLVHFNNLLYEIIEISTYSIYAISNHRHFTFSHCFTIPTMFSLILISLISLITLISSLFKSFKNSNQFSVLIFSCFVCCGIVTHTLHDEQRWESHYTNIIKNEPSLIAFEITKRLKPSKFHYKYEASIQRIDSINTKGRILLNIEKDSLANHALIGNRFYAYATLDSIRPPLNPYQFNYSEYLQKQYIYKQLTIKSTDLNLVDSSKVSIYSYANRFRERITNNLQKSTFSDAEISIIQALLLGQRQDLSEEIQTNFSKAGVIHILAVSGLHVGIILFILQFLLSPIDRIKRGNYIKMVLIVLTLWCFAIIAGLSPSVTRAVTMFTIVAIAMNLKRITNIYNTLAISAFVILLLKPMYLFDVGFQMRLIQLY